MPKKLVEPSFKACLLEVSINAGKLSTDVELLNDIAFIELFANIWRVASEVRRPWSKTPPFDPPAAGPGRHPEHEHEHEHEHARAGTERSRPRPWHAPRQRVPKPEAPAFSKSLAETVLDARTPRALGAHCDHARGPCTRRHLANLSGDFD
jgi:hypothetical protein